jgi:hypothetical protein
MFGNAEGGEGIGYVRPVYDLGYWQNPGAGMGWITEYRFGGGAGVWNDTPSHDSDTRDPNAMDVVVGSGQAQAEVLAWQAGRVRLPMLGLARSADTTPPTVSAALDPAQPDGGGVYRSPVTVTLQGADDRPGDLALEYRLDGGAWTAYAAPLVVKPDGSHTIEYRATDAAGNRSEAGTKSFRIDKPSEDGVQVGGDVPAVLSLSLGGSPISLGTFLPGIAHDYTAVTTATVTSTAAGAALTVADPSTTSTGRLVNGAFSLPQPLQARAGTSPFAPVGGASSPTALLGFDGPVSGGAVTFELKQAIGGSDTLRSGTYGKTLTFTLSTTTP